MINSNVTTIMLDGNETTIEFSTGYPYYFITNNGDNDMYVSISEGITPKADGTYTIAVGETTRIGKGVCFNKFYILGTGEAYIRGEQTAFPPSFKSGEKGGDSSDYTLPVASISTLGGVKPDNETVVVNNDGILSTKLPIYKSGKIMRSVTDTPVEIILPNDNWYAIVLNSDGIPPFALYIARQTDQIALVRLAVHPAAENNIYAYASVLNVNGVNRILIHSTDSGNVDYAIYKLPF